MNEKDIIHQVIDEIAAAAPSGVEVRTVGGDQDVSPPEIIVDWNATRLSNENGHTSFGGYIRDVNDNVTGVEHHTYWAMEIDCTARYDSEPDRDAAIDTIHSAFTPYEMYARSFDRDTREWEVGSEQPRQNPVIEPDWYEARVLLTFEYVKRADETRDTIETINKSITA